MEERPNWWVKLWVLFEFFKCLINSDIIHGVYGNIDSLIFILYKIWVIGFKKLVQNFYIFFESIIFFLKILNAYIFHKFLHRLSDCLLAILSFMSIPIFDMLFITTVFQVLPIKIITLFRSQDIVIKQNQRLMDLKFILNLMIIIYVKIIDLDAEILIAIYLLIRWFCLVLNYFYLTLNQIRSISFNCLLWSWSIGSYGSLG